jgi:predicted HAD superfamily phosphohydrolase YqeG
VSLRFNRATVIGFSATRTRVQLTFQELKFPGQKSLVSELDKKIVTISTNKLSEALTVLLEE